MKRKTVVGVVIAVVIVGALGIGIRHFIQYKTEQKATKMFEEQTIPKVATENQMKYLEGYYTTTTAFNKQSKDELEKTADTKETTLDSNVDKVTKRKPNVNGIDIFKNKVIVLKHGKEIYKTTDTIYSRVIKVDEFKEIFGVNPADLGYGLDQKTFVVYKVGNINMFKLAGGDLLFTYDGILNYGLDDNAISNPNEISYWYGNYQVTNKIVKPRFSDGELDKNLTGKEVIINKDEFKYGNETIKDPQYYIFEEKPEELYNKKDFKGEVPQNGEKVFFLGVLPKGDKLTRLEKYMATNPDYKSKALTPIILKSNGEIAVMNIIGSVFNANRVLPSSEN